MATTEQLIRVWLVALLVNQLQLASSNRNGQLEAAQTATEHHQSGAHHYEPSNPDGNNGAHQKHAGGAHLKCSRQSIILTRQMLAHELGHLNQFNAFWFSDLDREELIEGQKHSLSNIVMSGSGASLLNSEGQPLIEIESSYFRQAATAHHQTTASSVSNATTATAHSSAMVVKLLRKHADRCHLSSERGQFSYTVGLSIGPVEHHLDVIYNLPKDLRPSQPIDWRYGQISISAPRMNYEVTFKQAADYKLDGRHQQQAATTQRGATAGAIGQTGCPLEVSDVTYLGTAAAAASSSQAQGKAHGAHQGISIASSGLALNNQTQLQIERLFDDYTRPTVSHRLRQMLKFYLNSRTFPLAAAAIGGASY